MRVTFCNSNVLLFTLHTDFVPRCKYACKMLERQDRGWEALVDGKLECICSGLYEQLWLIVPCSEVGSK